MSERESTSKLTDWATSLTVGRVSRVTLGLLLTTHLQVSAMEARTSGLARLTLAVDGMSSSALAYDQAELTFASHARPAATFQMWLTQFATVSGYLIGSGARPRDWSSYRIQMRETLSTSEARVLFDVGDFMTKRERARELTRWVLGDGKHNRDIGLLRLTDLLWHRENLMRSGLLRT
jgi:hypothetical protein